MNGRFYVGEWLVEPEQSRVVRGSETAKLDPKAVQVLTFLAKHPNDVVTKEAVFAAVWDGAFVSDEVLTTAIWGLRKALGDDAKEPRYIQTVPRRGYRLIAPVEGVTGEASGRWEPSPYPGLAAFSQRDAEYFFGREQEVESLWTKLQEQTLLGLIGPSGAGKSSLLRAGLVPRAPEGWNVTLCLPRMDSYDRLSQVLEGPASDGRTLWILDQFEELFTLRDEETQRRFAELLGRASESGIHVLLSMRDDFLIRCHAHPPLEPVFKDVTPVLPLEGAAVRKALVEPARASGYRFEDEALVAEILTEVSKEKGALPLLAFAASKLWERRDRERRLLTREAYLSIGGVGGALAHHAEKTLSEIGAEPVVREIFRNLTTASGTRLPMSREELFTVFPEREEASRVLGALIDSRLLTSTEAEVEVIHESLLSAWPRLVRWQAGDAAGAVLRDQLRQAARAWQERGRPEDLLWTETSFRELALWRECYRGGLTAGEEEFAEASARLAGRRRRRRRIAAAAGFAFLLAVVAVVTSLWRTSVLEVSRREAAQILALGRLELEDKPTAALAHALASLERADSDEARRFALEALWHGAPAIVLPGNINEVDFSPDGKWLATGGIYAGAQLWSIEGGPSKPLGDGRLPQFSPRSDFLAAWEETARFWSVPEGGALGEVELEGETGFFRRGSHLFSLSTQSGAIEVVRDWGEPGEDPGIVTSLDFSGLQGWDIDTSGEWFAAGLGNGVYVSPLRDPSRDRARLIGTHPSRVVSIASHPTASRIVSADETGEIRIWSFSEGSQRLERSFRAPVSLPQPYLDPGNSWLIAAARGAHSNSEAAYLWDLKGPPDAEPVILRNGNVKWLNRAAVDPEGRWFVYAESNFGVLWPLDSKHARVLRGQAPPFLAVRFTPDGRNLLSTSDDGTVRLWPLSSQNGARSSVLMEGGGLLGPSIGVDPLGRYVLVGDRFRPRVFLVPLEGGEPRQMPGLTQGEGWVGSPAFSPDGRLAVATGLFPSVLRIWDLDSNEVRMLDTHVPGEEGCNPEKYRGALLSGEFLADGRLLSQGDQGIRFWDLKRGTSRQIRACREEQLDAVLSLDRARRRAVVAFPDTARASELGVLDVDTGAFRTIPSHGSRISAVAIDSSGTIAVTGDFDGVVRVGPIDGSEPHLLYGHALEISSVAVSPDGKWVASGSQDGTIRLWPMPEGKPFHTLPFEELLSRLRGLTNLRVVSDESSGTAYRVEIGPFPGWKDLPTW
jgi:WD40 repeat protein/DNA-binding winged helix-turn-helix (wHTH) protein